MSKKIVYYNQENKQKFIDSIVEDSRKRFAMSLFGKTCAIEKAQDRDIYDFSQEEIIELCMNLNIIVSKELWFADKILNDWKFRNGKEPFEFPDDSAYKKMYIAKGNLEYVLSLEELLSEINSVIKSICEKNHYYDDSEWLMPKAYIILKYYGLNDEEIQALSSKKLFPTYTLPNNITIQNDEVKAILRACYTGEEFKAYYENGNHRIIKYNPDFEDQIIKRSRSTMLKKWNTIPIKKLQVKNVTYAGKFYKAYLDDMNKEIGSGKAQIVLSRSRILCSMTNNLSVHGFSLVEEELYQVYKAIKINRYAQLSQKFE